MSTESRIRSRKRTEKEWSIPFTSEATRDPVSQLKTNHHGASRSRSNEHSAGGKTVPILPKILGPPHTVPQAPVDLLPLQALPHNASSSSFLIAYRRLLTLGRASNLRSPHREATATMEVDWRPYLSDEVAGYAGSTNHPSGCNRFLPRGLFVHSIRSIS